MGRLSKRDREKNRDGGSGGGVKRFRLHMLQKCTSAVRSNIWSKLIFASSCVILRSRVLRVVMGDRAGGEEIITMSSER